MRTPKNAHLWLPGYLRSLARRESAALVDLLFCVADHFEPELGGAAWSTRLARVRRWHEEYPPLADGFRDADGMRPRHTFFFPAEAYHPELVEPIAALCDAGIAETEVHLHHDNDTGENLRRTLLTFTTILRERHGLLAQDRDGRTVFGFIHGNWALDNSLRGGRHCGVNDELSILIETGCYADFTMPAVPFESQSSIVNAVYLATDDPLRPASHRTGTLARAGTPVRMDQLMIIPGPLQLTWRSPRHGVLPRIDTSLIDFRNLPTADRCDRWIKAGVGIVGLPSWVFVKIHTHGAPEANADVLLGAPMQRLHEVLTTTFNDGRRYRLHYVSAREMANIARAATDGMSGNPGMYRDYRYRRAVRS